MKLSFLSHLPLALLMLLLAAGCGSDQPAAPQGSAGDASALLPLTFYHVEDSDGGKPGDGVDVALVFEPNGIADLYVARETEAIARKGSYSIREGSITLTFTDDDFKIDASFTIDTSRASLTLPFKVFSDGTGSSTWRRERSHVANNIDLIFSAATLAGNLPTDQAMARATAYANAMMEIDRLAKPAHAKRALFDDRKLTGVKPYLNGIELQFDEGPYVNVQLFSASVGRGVPLTLSPLASDPRVHLDPESPHNGGADPDEKSALFFAPFDDDRDNITWYDFDFFNHRVSIPSSQTVQNGWGSVYEVDEMKKTLEGAGYRVQVLKNGDASIINLIEALVPGKGGRAHTPGFVAMITHGNAVGNLHSGTILGDDTQWQAAFKAEVEKLKARGYGDLVTYDGGTEEQPKVIGVTWFKQSMRANRGWVRDITIRPKFWEWLRTGPKADFGKSLVFIAACLTDQSPDLREAIRARAYFAFNVSVYVGFASKALRYFCQSLTRPTHSAEETYYNLVRVMNTRQMIYAEDKLFDNNMSDVVGGQADSTSIIFKGYGYDGEEIISYWSTGWMKGKNIDPGSVWWLLFAGRWGQNAHEGALGLKGCWDEYWSKGEMPGLADPGCQNKAPGRPPTANELAYASYLLDGAYVIPSTIFKIPRWTLNDGR